MNDQDIQKFKKLLLERQQELLEDQKVSLESTKTVDLDQSSVGRLSRMDAMQSQQMALETKRRQETQLTRIKAALERIDNGEFGYCASCDEEINPNRLKVDPANPFCVDCASKL